MKTGKKVFVLRNLYTVLREHINALSWLTNVGFKVMDNLIKIRNNI